MHSLWWLQRPELITTEDDEQTMARFLNGLNHPIKKIADFQPYSNLIELVHQATKAERQVQDDFKYAKYSSKTYLSALKDLFPPYEHIVLELK